MAAAKATDRLFAWCKMPDTGDPRVYLAGAAAIIAEYPQEVMDAIADPRTGTRVLKDYPSLRDIRAACEELNAPLEREAERPRSLSPPPRRPRTPEQQARVDAQVSDGKMRRIRTAVAPTSEIEIIRRASVPAHPSGLLAPIRAWR